MSTYADCSNEPLYARDPTIMVRVSGASFFELLTGQHIRQNLDKALKRAVSMLIGRLRAYVRTEMESLCTRTSLQIPIEVEQDRKETQKQDANLPNRGRRLHNPGRHP